MKGVWKILVLVIVILAIWWWRSRGAGGSAPDQRMASRIQQICDIAKKYADAPVDGVEHLFTHFAKTTADQHHDFGALIVMIQRIADDDARDDRARLAGRRLQAPFIACASDLNRFGKAIETSPEASSRLQRGIERLQRTVQLILDPSADRAGATQFDRWLTATTAFDVR